VNAEPLTREEREMLIVHLRYPSRDPATSGWDDEYPDEMELHQLWEATVQQAERRAEIAEKALEVYASIDPDDEPWTVPLCQPARAALADIRALLLRAPE